MTDQPFGDVPNIPPEIILLFDVLANLGRIQLTMELLCQRVEMGAISQDGMFKCDHTVILTTERQVIRRNVAARLGFSMNTPAAASHL